MGKTSRAVRRRRSLAVLTLVSVIGMTFVACSLNDAEPSPTTPATSTVAVTPTGTTPSSTSVATPSPSTIPPSATTSAPAATSVPEPSASDPEASPSPTAPSATPSPDGPLALIPAEGTTRERLTVALEAWAAQRSRKTDEVSIGIYDRRTDQTVLVNANEEYVTASIVKVFLTSGLATRRIEQGTWLSAEERRLARASITVSDNAATSAVFNRLGRPAGGVAFAAAVGMPHTAVRRSWGLTTTTAGDQLTLLRALAYGDGGAIPERARTYVLDLMGQVAPDQDWGVSAGPQAAGAEVELKNGWLPRSGGWVVNSIGHVEGDGRDYVIAVLSRGSAAMPSGVKTVEGASSIAWAVLQDPLSE